MTAGKIHLTNDKPTFFATLYGKALDARKPNPILGDPWAAEAVDRIDLGSLIMRFSESYAPERLNLMVSSFGDTVSRH